MRFRSDPDDGTVLAHAVQATPASRFIACAATPFDLPGTVPDVLFSAVVGSGGSAALLFVDAISLRVLSEVLLPAGADLSATPSWITALVFAGPLTAFAATNWGLIIPVNIASRTFNSNAGSWLRAADPSSAIAPPLFIRSMAVTPQADALVLTAWQLNDRSPPSAGTELPALSAAAAAASASGSSASDGQPHSQRDILLHWISHPARRGAREFRALCTSGCRKICCSAGSAGSTGEH